MGHPETPGPSSAQFGKDDWGADVNLLANPKALALEALKRVAFALRCPIDRSLVDFSVALESTALSRSASPELLVAAARQVGIFIKETELQAADVHSTLVEGYPVIVTMESGAMWVCEASADKRVTATRIGERITACQLGNRQLRDLLREQDARIFVAKRELECDVASTVSPRQTAHSSAHTGHSHAHQRQGGGHHHHAHGISPQRRFLRLLSLDARDVGTVLLFALVAGLLALATPLAIEALVNVVNWGTYLQPLLILAAMLAACLGIAGILEILETVVVELIQRRQFVRIIGDLAHRFPRANQHALSDHYPRELANRIFDVMTIQKSTATVLLDGVSILMATVLGMGLLAVYHPYLLVFNLVLLACMAIIVLVLGRGGIRTAVRESIIKYEVAYWLQDVLAMPSAFKVNGGESLAIDRANRLMTEYIDAREGQFRVVLRQITFAVGLQVVASTVLLGLGGWLVMRQELSPGQLVASELVITLVVGAFAKAGKSLEKYYDLMAGVDKVGHLLDIPVDLRLKPGKVETGPVDVRWGNLVFHEAATGAHLHIPSNHITAGSKVAVLGEHAGENAMLAKALAGLAQPTEGLIEIGGLEVARAAFGGDGRVVGYAGNIEIFHGTIQENVDLGRAEVGHARLREVLTQVNLWDDIIALSDGLRTMLHTDGAPLSVTQRRKLMLARAMAGEPRLLLIDGLLDGIGEETRKQMWQAIASRDHSWTVIIITNDVDNANLCDQVIQFAGNHA